MNMEIARDGQNQDERQDINLEAQRSALTQEALSVEDEARLVNRQHGEKINMFRTQIALADAMGLDEQVRQFRNELNQYVELKGELTEVALTKAKQDIVANIAFARSISGAVNQNELPDKFSAILEDHQQDDLSKRVNLSALEALGGTFGANLEVMTIPRQDGSAEHDLHVIRLPENINTTTEDIYITNSTLALIDNQLRIFKMSKKFREEHDISIKEADINSIYDKESVKNVETDSQVIN